MSGCTPAERPACLTPQPATRRAGAWISRLLGPTMLASMAFSTGCLILVPPDRPDPTEPALCLEDADCADDERCATELDICLTPQTEDGEGAAAVCYSMCVGAEDAGPHLLDGGPPECAVDADCGEGLLCSDGTCITIEECQAAAPQKRYVGDPEMCTRINFVCDDNERYFADSCGCGCEPVQDVCETDEECANGQACVSGVCQPLNVCEDEPADPRKHYVGSLEECAYIDFACADNQEYFADDCGCGCIDMEPECQDPNDPRVQYVAPPEVCSEIDFDCNDGAVYFSDACGCGCIEQDELPDCEARDPDQCELDGACELDLLFPPCAPCDDENGEECLCEPVPVCVPRQAAYCDERTPCANGAECVYEGTVCVDCAPGEDCEGGCFQFGTCADAPPPPPRSCMDDADCGEGQECLMSEDICLPPPGCEQGEPCPAVCAGMCVDAAPEPRACLHSEECANGEHCVFDDATCLPPPGCEEGEPCPTVCAGQCLPLPPPPPPVRTCLDSDDCGAGEHCVFTETTECLPPPGCEDGQPCPDVCAGQCMPREPGVDTCLSDEDCADNEVCMPSSAAVCLPPPGCENGEPCPDVCADICVPRDEPNACDLVDCPDGQECVELEVQCVTAPCPPVAQCVDVDPDPCATVLCEEGSHCEMQDVQCVMAPCPPIAQCVPDVPEGACRTDADCGEHERCIWPEIDCPDGAVCQAPEFGQCFGYMP